MEEYIPFDKWAETAKPINVIPMDTHGERKREVYKTPNGSFIYLDTTVKKIHTIFHAAFGPKIKEIAAVDWNILKTKENVELIKSMDGWIDSDWAYTTEDRGMPVFRSLEVAYNFSQTMRDKLRIPYSKDHDLFGPKGEADGNTETKE